MDKKQAQFILQSYRPDGSDALDADFTDALCLAANDSELGEWLAVECAEDASFAAALSDVEIPVELRQQIIEMMDMDQVYAQVHELGEEDPLDKIFMNAVDQLQPPRGLRDQLLTAMHVEHAQQTVTPLTGQKRWIGKVSSMVAVAAAVVVGAFWAYELTPLAPSSDQLFESHQVQHHAGNFLQASFEYDVEDDDPERIHSWLVNRELPTPTNIPQGLKKLSCAGCKEIKLPGAKRASMVCYSENASANIYLIIVNNADILDRGLPTLSELRIKDCYHCKVTNCSCARWQDAHNTYILLKKAPFGQKAELMNYL
ncbi:MAG: hypothetical protein P8P36_04230 [Akkermansiaceae bacterium]|nr:hypothetical protein [Akkermansiaceae bacterium]